MRDDNCIFCKIAGGDIPTNAIYEDNDYKVIGYEPGHKGACAYLTQGAL